MKGSEAKLLGFMEGANNRYVIPVYQRKYDWKIENCSKLYEDLKKIIHNKRGSHFFRRKHRSDKPDCTEVYQCS